MTLWNKLVQIRERVIPNRESISRDVMIFPCGISRSGTTLLSAILDAHSQISLGYEILMPPLPAVDFIKSKLLEIGPKAENLRIAGSILRKQGINDLGKWVSRCYRLNINLDDLIGILENQKKLNGNSLQRLRKRLSLVSKVVELSKLKSNASISGFKITDSHFDRYLSFFPNAFFIYIARDPRDIFASLKDAGFEVTLESLIENWRSSLKSFEEFKDSHPDKCHLIKYEDLVHSSIVQIRALFKILGLEVEDSVINFHKSQAKILKSSHPNVHNLKKGFFATSVGRYRRDLSENEIKRIGFECQKEMQKYGYLGFIERSAPCNLIVEMYPIPQDELDQKQKLFSAKRKFKEIDYESLLKPYSDGQYEIMPLIDFVRISEMGDRRILIIRHDVDHDHLTAMKIARWENDHGIRSTYCLLHTAWYYGKLQNGRMVHSRDLAECAQYISSMGHEVILHNNIVVQSLLESIDPADFLSRELKFFESIGVPIKGTSTHGDKLCHELNFRNYELFKETCDGRYGGPRCLFNPKNGKFVPVTLGELPMWDFGLEYEAYEIFWDVYHTDSGGQMQTKTDRRGMRNFGRHDNSRGSLIGILTHPIWWQF